jgi:ligand-binding sensor domain-containing protein/signal transduction histidine kinase
MKIMRYIILSFLQLLWQVSFSQQKSIKFDHLDINSGLSQNNIICILQDSRGFMWFGTRDGLNKYDGYRFTIYKNDINDTESISNNFITSIVEDSGGIIWVATRGGGLNRYDRDKNRFTRFKNDPADPNTISSDFLSGLLSDKEGNLWVTTENAGVNYFRTKEKRISHYRYDKNNINTLSDDNTRYIFEDSRNQLWIGTNGGGLNKLDKKTGKCIRFVHDENDKTSLSHNNVRVIFEDSRHWLWVGTVGGGLNLFDQENGMFLNFMQDINNKNSLSSDVVVALGEDESGNLWIGTENGGLDVLDRGLRTFQHYVNDEIDNRSISHNSIYSIYKDAYGTIWVGTFAGGVNIFSQDANRFAHYKRTSFANSLSHNNVLSIEEGRNGKLWIGTDGGGLNLFDPATKKFTTFRHDEKNKNSICGNSILDVCEDDNGNLWIGTWANGLTVFNPEKGSYRHFKNIPGDVSSLRNNNVWTIFKDRDKNIWVGAYGGGLHLYNPDTYSFTRFDDTTASIVARQIYSIAEDNKGNLWIGTDGGGLRIFNKEKRSFIHFVHEDGKNSLSDNRINYVYQDRYDNFWLCTMSGLNYFDTRKQEFTIYTTEEGLPNNAIFGVLEDSSGSLWISTNRGLSRFDPRTKKFKNFGLADGLQSYEFKGHSLCKARSGALYFGGINGFNEFYPERIIENSFEPPLVLTGFQIFNKKVPIAKDDNDPSPLLKDISETREIALSYHQSVISFEFASLNYTVPEKKRYAYMLEGFDKNWNEIGTSRSAIYTNLDPGEYTFRVKGVNNEGEWSSRTIAIRLIIKPPYWMTWWFKLAIISLLAGCAIGFYTYRVRAIKTQRTKLQQQVTEQTLQLLQSAEEEQRARQEAEEANKELERKNKELEQFAYVASHDMQEPLRTTASFVQLLQKQYQGKLDETADKYFMYVLQSSERMKVLIQDLLDYSRIGRKQELERVDCNQVMEDMLVDLGIAIKEAQAEISYDRLPVIKGYHTEIKLLFQNLVINAIKFRKKDAIPKVKICARKKDGFWEFIFRDNGIGIDEKHGDRIFVIFQRLHNRNEYKGSGIGLAHCKKIVELHGGKIWFESVQGEGTAFHFTIREK